MDGLCLSRASAKRARPTNQLTNASGLSILTGRAPVRQARHCRRAKTRARRVGWSVLFCCWLGVVGIRSVHMSVCGPRNKWAGIQRPIQGGLPNRLAKVGAQPARCPKANRAQPPVKMAASARGVPTMWCAVVAGVGEGSSLASPTDTTTRLLRALLLLCIHPRCVWMDKRRRRRFLKHTRLTL